jgi:hypothetical protein
MLPQVVEMGDWLRKIPPHYLKDSPANGTSARVARLTSGS